MSAPAPDVIVVGGGAVGCAVAWFLAREGIGVELFERGELASEASGAAAGMLAPLVETDPTDPVGHIFLRWGRRSLARFPELIAELREHSGVDPEYRASGVLRIAADESAAGELRARAAALRADGLPEEALRWLDADEARALEPQLDRNLAGALHAPVEAHLRSPLLVRAYARGAARHGARIETSTLVLALAREGARVVGVETPGGRRPAGQVVVCAGAFSRALLTGAGLPDLPLSPVRGQIVILDSPDPPPSSILWGGATYLVPKADGSLVVGATEERVGFDCRVTAAGIAGLLTRAQRLVPALADAGFRGAWAGLRPETPDGLPLVGPVPQVEGLAIAAGHFRNGVLLSPATGELVREGVLGKGWAEPAFLPERYTERTTSPSR